MSNKIEIRIAWIPPLYEFDEHSKVTGYAIVGEHWLRFTASGIERGNPRVTSLDIDAQPDSTKQDRVALAETVKQHLDLVVQNAWTAAVLAWQDSWRVKIPVA